jgi:hypothetical protein
MTAAANTYGMILRIGGQAFVETLVETEIQQAVGYMEEQASAPTNLNPHSSSNPTGSTDGVGGYGEWSGSANRARIIAGLSSKLLASENATTASSLAIATAGLSPLPTLIIPSALQQQQLQSPTASTPGGKPSQREKEKILAPHARIAGVLILIQIATHAPQMYYQHTKLILSRILCPLRDGCRFWVVKGSDEDIFAGTDGLEGMIAEGGIGPRDGQSFFINFFCVLMLLWFFLSWCRSKRQPTGLCPSDDLFQLFNGTTVFCTYGIWCCK